MMNAGKNGSTTLGNFKDAKAAAILSDNSSMRDLYNAAATYYYVAGTVKTAEELVNFDACGWADGLDCDWSSVEACIEAAHDAADELIEQE